jgi:hypothetical protein
MRDILVPCFRRLAGVVPERRFGRAAKAEKSSESRPAGLESLRYIITMNALIARQARRLSYIMDPARNCSADLTSLTLSRTPIFPRKGGPNAMGKVNMPLS